VRPLLTVGALIVLGVCAVVAAGSAQPAPASAIELYVKMRAAVNALSVPADVAFTMQDASTRKDLLLQERLRIVVRSSDGHAWVRMLKNATGDVVHTPPGNGAGDLNPRRRWGIEPLRRLGVFGGFPACP
jgi:hypothetical protein